MKGKNSLVITGVLLLLVSSMVFFACAPAPEPPKPTAPTPKPPLEPYKIGVLMPMTGKASLHATGAWNGAQLFAEALNKAGGIDGRSIEVLVYNTELDPTKALAGFTKMVKEDKVVSIVGCF